MRPIAERVEVGPNLSNNTDVKTDLQKLNRICARDLMKMPKRRPKT